MVPSSKKASDRLAAWTSRKLENASAASVRMPIPPSCAAPLILAKGVSILTGLRYLAGDESEGAFAETKQGRTRGPVANEFVQHHAGVIRKIERGAIGEGDADGAIGSGLDRVVPVDRITDLDLGNNAAGAHDGD